MLYLLSLVLILVSCAGSPEGEPPSRQEDFLPLSQSRVLEDPLCSTALYDEFRELRTPGPLIPGLKEAAVPQGMAYIPESDLMVISNYMSDGSAGVLTLVNMEDGSLYGVIRLLNRDKSPHTGHLGGLALSRDFLWIASGPGVYPVPLDEITGRKGMNEPLILPPLIETETKGSFAGYSEGILWIGEFTRKDGSYPAARRHHRTSPSGTENRAWLAGYRLDEITDCLNEEELFRGKIIPDLVLSIPDEMQGVLFHEDLILLSASYGRKNYSRLHAYRNPLLKGNSKREEILPGVHRSTGFLDDSNRLATLILPPMSEAVVLYRDYFTLLFESAASKYRDTALCPLERLQFLAAEDYTRMIKKDEL